MINFLFATLGAFFIVGGFTLLRRFFIARVNIDLAVNIANGNLEEANRSFERLLVWCPQTFGQNPALILGTIDVSLLSSPLPKARLLNFFDNLVSKAIARVPNSPYSHLMAAGLKNQRHPGSDDSREHLIKAISHSNRNLSIYYHAGEIQMAAGMYREAKRYFSTFKNIARLSGEQKSVKIANMALAKVHSYTEAISVSHKDNAIKYLDLVINEEKNSSEWIYLNLYKANEYARCNQYTKAIEVLYNAFHHCNVNENISDITVILRGFINSLIHVNELDTLEKVLDTCISKGIENLDVEKARLLWQRGDEKEARKLLKQSLINSNDNPLILVAIAMVYREMGDMCQALSIMEQSLKKEYNLTSNNNYYSIKLRADSIDESLTKSLYFPFEPNNYGMKTLRKELADIYTELGRYDDAIKELKNIYKRNPNNPMACIDLGKALDLANRRDEADKYFRQAEPILATLLEEAPQSPLFNFAMAEICSRDGDIIQAIHHYQLADCYPYAKKAQEAIDKLNSDNPGIHLTSLIEETDLKSRLSTFLAI